MVGIRAQPFPLKEMCSIEGGEEVVDDGLGVSLGGHPVVEEEGIEAWFSLTTEDLLDAKS